MFVSLLFVLVASCSSFEFDASQDEKAHERIERNVKNDTQCPLQFPNPCLCGKQPYPHKESQLQFVVNCTNGRFTDVEILEFLPDETEVLIFTGNMLNELEDNIFGFDFNFKKLNYIDLSNNHITFIKGQTFHRVKNVETLILNFNDLEITERFEKHRIFSNFENLRYLHLTDAFTDRYNASAYYMLSLQDIFIESNLLKLERLHLEQNEIYSIGTNASIFCPLKNLRQLYLSDNKLSDLDFRIDCLDSLNHIDFRYNMISRFSDATMDRLDRFVASARPLSINIMDNPLVCDCRSLSFLEWLRTSGVKMDNDENYICTDGYPHDLINRRIIEVQLDEVRCPGQGGYSSGTVGVLTFFIIIMIIALFALGYYHKRKLSTLVQPLVNGLSTKVGYRGLAHEETPTEVNV